jgi:hypothetical protein
VHCHRITSTSDTRTRVFAMRGLPPQISGLVVMRDRWLGMMAPRVGRIAQMAAEGQSAGCWRRLFAPSHLRDR